MSDSETLLAILQQADRNKKIQICVLSPPTPEARKIETYNGHALYEYARVSKNPRSRLHSLEVLDGCYTFCTDKYGRIGGVDDRVIYYFPKDAVNRKKSSAVVCAHLQDKPKRIQEIRTTNVVDPLLMLLFVVGISRLDFLLDEFARSVSCDQDFKVVL